MIYEGILKDMKNEYYDFPPEVIDLIKDRSFVFIQSQKVDPFSGKGLLSRAKIKAVGDCFVVLQVSKAESKNAELKREQHVLLGLPGIRGFVRAYIHRKDLGNLYIGCMSNYLLKD